MYVCMCVCMYVYTKLWARRQQQQQKDNILSYLAPASMTVTLAGLKLRESANYRNRQIYTLSFFCPRGLGFFCFVML